MVKSNGPMKGYGDCRRLDANQGRGSRNFINFRAVDCSAGEWCLGEASQP